MIHNAGVQEPISLA